MAILCSSHHFFCVCGADRLYRVELFVETNGGVYARGIPYLSFSGDAKPNSVAHNVHVHDSGAIHEKLQLQTADSSVLSKSFYVRYSEETFDVNDTVVFQVEKVVLLLWTLEEEPCVLLRLVHEW